MNSPVHITFRHLPSSEILSEYIREQVEWLETHEARLQSCHVVVEPVSGNGGGSGQNTMAKRCRVRVEAHIPGATLVADRTPPNGAGHDDPHLAVRQAFETLRRQLDSRHDRRAHQRQLEGTGRSLNAAQAQAEAEQYAEAEY